MKQDTINDIKRRAEQGDATAKIQLGNMYEHGQGVEQDYKKAVELYTQASEQGHPTHSTI